MMRFLILTDTHFSLNAKYPDKFETDLQAFSDLYKNAITHKFNAVIHLGDLFEHSDRIHSPVVGRVFAIVKYAELVHKIPTIILAGNHDVKYLDMYEKNSISLFDASKLHYNSPLDMSEGHTKVIWGKGMLKLSDKFRIALIAYSRCDEDLKFLVNEAVHNECTGMLLGHFGLQGSGFGTLTLPDIQANKFQKVLLGHIHTHQYLSNNTLYVGSFFQHDFRDEGSSPGYCEVEIDEQEGIVVSLAFYSNTISKTFRTVDAPTEQDFSKFLDDHHQEHLYDNNYIRVRYSETLDRVTTNFNYAPSDFITKVIDKKDLTLSSLTDYTKLVEDYTHKNYRGNLNKDGVKKVGIKLIEKES